MVAPGTRRRAVSDGPGAGGGLKFEKGIPQGPDFVPAPGEQETACDTTKLEQFCPLHKGKSGVNLSPMQNELWSAVPRYNGLISASSHGRIRREARSTPGGRLAEMILAQRPHHENGYLIVQFKIDNKTHTALAHRLVLEAFVGPRPYGHEALHHDDCRTNNVLSNLRWGTPQENTDGKPGCSFVDPLAE